MADQDKLRFVSMLQSHKGLARAGVIFVERSSPQVLRLPTGQAPVIYIVLHQIDSTNVDWAGRHWRPNTEAQVAKAGVRFADAVFACVVSNRFVCFVGVGAPAGADAQSTLMEATKDMQEMQMSFNLDYLQLQNQMQNENRRFSLITNITKTKHDTVKSSISNVR